MSASQRGARGLGGGGGGGSVQSGSVAFVSLCFASVHLKPQGYGCAAPAVGLGPGPALVCHCPAAELDRIGGGGTGTPQRVCPLTRHTIMHRIGRAEQSVSATGPDSAAVLRFRSADDDEGLTQDRQAGNVVAVRRAQEP